MELGDDVYGKYNQSLAALNCKIFMSYARSDGAATARRLECDLRNHGYDPWLDVDRIEGGASWAAKIEQAIDDCEVVLALLTRGSYHSDICPAEQLRALRKARLMLALP